MNKVKNRTIIIILIAAVVIVGALVFLIRWEDDGEFWALYPFNSHAYHEGVFVAGQVADRNGTLLLSTTDGQRSYADDETLRRATLHVVGDANGNIGGSAQSFFRQQLSGYSMLNGLYSVTGAGRKLTLTIDAELNRTAYQALNGRNGCVLVYDYSNGAVLCLVSSPGFDPANAPSPDSVSNGEYINRALSATFAPGSTFKLVTLAAAIENIDDLFERSFTCDGYCEYGDEAITCPEAHGTMDIYGALANSCNGVFAQLGTELGADVLSEYAEKLGLTTPGEVSGYATASGVFDAAPVGSVDVGWSAIGQYHDLVCPVDMLELVAAIANNGQTVQPRLVRKVGGTGALSLPLALPELPQRSHVLSADTANKLRDMMLNNVQVKYGADSFPGLSIGAKSGTAEVDGASPHAWFTGFLDDPAHPLAFVVLVENGGSGADVAGAVANQVLQAAVNND